jgi:hypothetical protein
VHFKHERVTQGGRLFFHSLNVEFCDGPAGCRRRTKDDIDTHTDILLPSDVPP